MSIENDCLELAKQNGNAVLYCLITLPNGKQLNVTAMFDPMELSVIGEHPKSRGKLDEVFVTKLLRRDERIKYFMERIVEPATNVLVQTAIEAACQS